MTTHPGLVAVLIVLGIGAIRRFVRERHPRDLLLALLAFAALGADSTLWVREARLSADWTDRARTELRERLDRIVGALRDEGGRALDDIRTVALDADTRALLSDEPQLARLARHPVFLDLRDRWPVDGREGVTVYDRGGHPRAWAGWTPTATMSLPREPRGAVETIRIRKGNIFTVLEAIHPVAARDGGGGDERPLGWVVLQKPMRVQFPLESWYVRLDDELGRLEGGGGVRADLALELSVGDAEAIRTISIAVPKVTIGNGRASASAAILSASGDAVGRVSLSGLSRAGLAGEGLAGLRGLRVVLLLATFLLAGIRLWFAAGALDRRIPRPAGLAGALVRVAIALGGRWALHRWQPWRVVDPFDVFHPDLYASMRWDGFLRSPGEAGLTFLAVALAVREIRRVVVVHEPSIRAAARRVPWAAAPAALAPALLVGSLAGLHWARALDVARNANSPLYGGFDPFSSWAVAALEVALLLLGAAFLAAGDVLVRLASALADRLPGRVAGPVLAAAAAFATAVKIEHGPGLDLRASLARAAEDGAGTLAALAGAAAARLGPFLEFLSDLLPAIPALVALALFHRMSRGWARPGAAALLATSVLASVVGFLPVREGMEMRRRELVEIEALQRNESPAVDRQILLQSSLDQLVRSDVLQTILDDTPSPEQANVAFILWAHSPLAKATPVGDPAGCLLRLVDADGEPVSTFSLDYPPELRQYRLDPGGLPPRGVSRFHREELGTDRIDVYTRALPLVRGDRTLGAVELSLAYWDDLARARAPSRPVTSVFANLPATREFLRFRRDVPDRVDRYRGEELVASTDPEGALGKRVRPAIVRALSDPTVSGRWEPGRLGGKVYDLYHVRERDGDETVGYLSFGIERHGVLHGVSLLARSALVTLVLAAGIVALLVLVGWTAPGDGTHRLRLPRLGFRERVIGGFLLVSLLPTVLLGTAGRRLFVEEKRREFEERLLGDLEVSTSLLGRRLSDAARNAAGSDEILELRAAGGGFRTLSTPASVDGIVVADAQGRVIGASRAADLDLALLGSEMPAIDGAREFFRRRGDVLYACASVPLAADGPPSAGGGVVLSFQRVDALLAAELERRVGSTISWFAGGRLVATSKPELYQAEILSDLVNPDAYRRIELEGWRRLLQRTDAGSASFLASYAPLFDENGQPVAIAATLAPFSGRGLDLDAGLVLSRIYFLCLLVFAGAIAAAVVLAGRLTGPLSELTAGAARIGAGQFGHRILARAPAEIGALVRSFNEMSERLATSEARDRERREYIEAIIRHVASGVVSFDAGGRLATVNEAAARILEVDPSAAIGRAPAHVAGSPAFAAVVAAMEPVMRGRREEVVHEFEAAASGSDEPRSIRLVGTPLLDREGRPQGAVCVFEDLTDLIRSKKITAWAEMARQVAHEIKNPLTPMKLSAQQLRAAWRDKHPKLDRIVEESTETIIDRCEALRRIAVEFSDYARMPGRTIRREDLGRLLREARRLYGDTAERRVAFSLEAPEGDLWTRIDRDEVMRLFINLFENSIQAMPEGGDLRVEAHRENGSARVTIADSGAGIAPENLGRIWEPSFSTKTGGAGLGLPICKAIMEDYGGTIRIRSEAGQGTTVTLVFPVDETDAPDAA